MEDSIKAWDARTGALLAIWKGHSKPIRALALSPDGSLALSGSEDTTVRLWETATGKCLKVWTGHEGRVRAVAFSPDGKRALSASDDRTLRLWDVGAAFAKAKAEASKSEEK